ncbi:MAG TPA: carbohydrate ABC transporter permease [Thermomicrobiales bacterium]|jgi:multiple sugar transport system permease protein/putative chitobiose transport system permease protein|nr:carbohydrate ABC transporter permease [Thermomicrobiales bacterium]
MTRRSTGLRWPVYLLSIAVCVLFLGPLLWGLASSLRPLDEIFRYTMPFSLKALYPTTPTLDAYREIFFGKGFGRAILNTALVAVATVVGGLLVAALAGFAFARLEFPGKRILFVLTVVTFMVPFEAIAIPLYDLIQGFGWIDSYQALIVPGVANGIAIFLFRQFFAEIPSDLVDAARLDGASWLGILFQIFLPLSKPVMIGASLLLFLFQWESFLWPLIAVRSEQYKVVQVALSDFQQQYQTLWNELFAASIVAAVIPLLLLLPLQRYYVQSVVGTGLK